MVIDRERQPLLPGFTSFATRAEWLAARRTGIGGSDAVAIMGQSVWRSPYAVWASKMGLVEDDLDQSISEAAQWGTILESPVREEWERRTGLRAIPCTHGFIRDIALPCLIASPDGLVGDEEGLEIKAVNERKGGEWEDDVPLGYQIQCQHYLGVTGRKRWHVAALIGGQKLVIATVERNERFISALRAKLSTWWEQHVIRKIAPEVDASESTTNAIKRAFAKEIEGEPIEFAAEFEEYYKDLKLYKKTVANMEKEIDIIENKIKATLGTASRGILPNGLGEFTYKTQKRAAYSVAAGESRVLRHVKGAK